MVEFEKESDKIHVLKDGPWHFDKSFVFTKEFEGELQICNMQLKEALFWIRVFDLPLMTGIEHVGKLVRSQLVSLLRLIWW